jgi:predicted RNA-binding protein with PUA-like domain
MKSEPDVYGVNHLANQPGTTDHWDGIRNYQARNMMRDQMKMGDQAFFYHSNCKQPGIAGIMEIAHEAYPDHTAFDPESRYFDPKSDSENPRWLMVDVQLLRKLKRIITLAELRDHPELQEMVLLRRGNRLSITQVTPEQWNFILDLE